MTSRGTRILEAYTVISSSKSGLYNLSDHDYAVPGYQLKLAPVRHPDLTMSPDSIEVTADATPVPTHFEIGQLVLYLATENGFDDLEVAEIESIHEEHLTCIKYWCDSQRKWLKSKNELVDISFRDVIASGFPLSHNKIPTTLLRRVRRDAL
jgi:hypothetical protein